jgi:hypothetical protein
MTERQWVITIHPTPDTDALFAACAAITCLDLTLDQVVIRFDSDPAPAWHNPNARRLTMDVGRGELDHHRLDNPRSTCAFIETCEMFARSETWPLGAERAQALLDRLGQIVLMQDSTGVITPDRDRAIQAMSLPSLINRTVWMLQDDQAAWDTLAPMILSLFRAEISAWQVRNTPRAIWLHPDLSVDITSPREVVRALRMRRAVGTFSPLDHVRDLVWEQFPTCQVLITHTTWGYPHDPGIIISQSIWLSVRRGSGLHAKSLIADLLEQGLCEDIRSEIQSWWAEERFAGRGGMKFQRPEPLPANFLSRLFRLVRVYLEGV